MALSAQSFRARLEADAIVGAELIGRPVLAFAGIARPEKFFATLEGLGAQIAARRRFPDHHAFDPREIDEIVAVALRRGLTPVTTEKDYVRLTAAQRGAIRALPVTLRFETPERVAAALAEALPCGGSPRDRAPRPRPWAPSRRRNLGEIAAPANGPRRLALERAARLRQSLAVSARRVGEIR